MSGVTQKPVHPGKVLEARLEEIGWNVPVLGMITGRDPSPFYEIIRGEKAIAPVTALQLAAVFGDSPDEWLQLQASYDLAIAEARDTEKFQDYRTLGALHRLIPNLKEAEKRGWLPKNVESHEKLQAAYDLLGVSEGSAPDLSRYIGSALPGGRYETLTLNLWWSVVSKVLEGYRDLRETGTRTLKEAALEDLGYSGRGAESIALGRGILLHAGVELLVVPAPKGLRIDAAASWHPRPIIALTLRKPTYGHVWWSLASMVHLLLGKRSTGVWVWNTDLAWEALNTAEHEAVADVDKAHELQPLRDGVAKGDIQGKELTQTVREHRLDDELIAHRLQWELGKIRGLPKWKTDVSECFWPPETDFWKRVEEE